MAARKNVDEFYEGLDKDKPWKPEETLRSSLLSEIKGRLKKVWKIQEFSHEFQQKLTDFRCPEYVEERSCFTYSTWLQFWLSMLVLRCFRHFPIKSLRFGERGVFTGTSSILNVKTNFITNITSYFISNVNSNIGNRQLLQVGKVVSNEVQAWKGRELE